MAFHMYLPMFSRLGRVAAINQSFKSLTSSTDLRGRNSIAYKFSKSGDRKEFSVLESQASNFTNEQSVLHSNSDITSQVIQLRSLEKIHQVLEYLRTNPQLPPNKYSNVFYTMYKIHVKGDVSLSKAELFHTPEVEELAQLTKKNIRHLKMKDCIIILKSLTYFEISTNSLLGQYLLQHVAQNINSFEIIQIVDLSSILRKCQPSPLVEIVMSSLRIVFEAQLKTQFNPKDPECVLTSLKFALREKVSKEIQVLLVNAALCICDIMDVQQIVRLINTITQYYRGVPELSRLYSTLIEKMTSDIDQYSLIDVIQIHGNMVRRYMHTNVNFFKEPFVQSVINRFITKQSSLLELGVLSRQLIKISYYSPELIDHIDGILSGINNFEEEQLPSILIFSFLMMCSNCSYKPANWSSYEFKIVSYVENRKDSDIPFVRLVTDLIILECWSKNLIQHCFSEELMNRDMKRTVINRLDFWDLYQIVRPFYPQKYSGELPSQNLINTISKEFISNTDYPLLESLQHALGGAEYVLPGVRTNFTNFIQYLIVKNNLGSFHPINQNKITTTSGVLLESLDIPDCSHPIAVMLLSPTSFCFEGLRIRGKVRILHQCIQNMGAIIVPISEFEWSQLPDVERIPYLLQKIDCNLSVPSETE